MWRPNNKPEFIMFTSFPILTIIRKFLSVVGEVERNFFNILFQKYLTEINDQGHKSPRNFRSVLGENDDREVLNVYEKEDTDPTLPTLLFNLMSVPCVSKFFFNNLLDFDVPKFIFSSYKGKVHF